MPWQPYPNYRAARLRWLPSIPEHWREQRAKTFFREVDERSETGQEELLSVSHLTGVTPRSQKNVSMFKAESYVGSKMCRPGDIVVNTLWAWMAALGVSRHSGIVSPAYGVYRAHECGSFNADYFDYLLRIPAYVAEYTVRSTGIRASRLRLYPNQFLDIPLLCPPLDEQNRIAAWLRAQDARIARYIQQRRALMQRLDEQKRALISHTVTHGVGADPCACPTGQPQGVAPTKPSGVPWLGDVPAHWEVACIKHVVDVRFSGVDKHSYEGEIPIYLCNYTDVYKNAQIVSGMDFMRATATPNEIERFSLKMGDVLITKDSETADDIGVPSLVPQTLPGVICAYHLALLRPKTERIIGEFLFYSIASLAVSQQLHVQAAGVTRFGLSKNAVKDTVIALPPLAEQHAICRYIEEQTRPLDDAIASLEKEIALVLEYRQRQISDAVTGQIDLRGWQPGPGDVVDDALLSALGDENEDVTEEEDENGEY